ncbi:hypothetical protein COOONC_25115, partial [Cooperia oncophora]
LQPWHRGNEFYGEQWLDKGASPKAHSGEKSSTIWAPEKGLVINALPSPKTPYEMVFLQVYKFYGSQRHAVPRGSNASPEEIANVIAFLADRKLSSYIVGQMIVADGGTSLIMGAYTYDFDKVLSS